MEQSISKKAGRGSISLNQGNKKAGKIFITVRRPIGNATQKRQKMNYANESHWLQIPTIKKKSNTKKSPAHLGSEPTKRDMKTDEKKFDAD